LPRSADEYAATFQMQVSFGGGCADSDVGIVAQYEGITLAHLSICANGSGISDAGRAVRLSSDKGVVVLNRV